MYSIMVIIAFKLVSECRVIFWHTDIRGLQKAFPWPLIAFLVGDTRKLV